MASTKLGPELPPELQTRGRASGKKKVPDLTREVFRRKGQSPGGTHHRPGPKEGRATGPVMVAKPMDSPCRKRRSGMTNNRPKEAPAGALRVQTGGQRRAGPEDR